MVDKLALHGLITVNLNISEETLRDGYQGLLWPLQEEVYAAAINESRELTSALRELRVDGGEGKDNVEIGPNPVKEEANEALWSVHETRPLLQGSRA